VTVAISAPPGTRGLPTGFGGGARRTWGLIVSLAVLATPVVAATSANPLTALVPVLALAGAFLLWSLSLAASVPILLLLTLTLENPAELPGKDLASFGWHPPLSGAGRIFFSNVTTLLPGSGIPLSVLEVAILILCLRAAVQTSSQGAVLSRAGAFAVPVPLAFRKSLALAAVTIGGFEFYGLATHGSLQDSLYQIREPLGMLGIAYITATAGSGLLIRRLRAVALSAALIKAVQTLYAYVAIARVHHVKPDYISTHSDSTLYVWALVILLAERAEPFSRRRRSLRVVMAIVLLGATIVNNRRLAWVAFLGAILWVAAASTPEVKRRWGRRLLLVSPVIAIYVVAGLGSTSTIFFPVKAVSSVVSADDSSSRDRQVENTNLIVTFKADPLIGSGFGHKYVEQIKADDISGVFKQYRYLPHNSILGLWAFTGVVGFALFWQFFVVSVSYAAAALRRSSSRQVRSIAQWTVAGVIAFMLQAQGDIGLQSWIAAAIAGTCGGVAVSLNRLSDVPPRAAKQSEAAPSHFGPLSGAASA
jgi:hypothetical protein